MQIMALQSRKADRSRCCRYHHHRRRNGQKRTSIIHFSVLLISFFFVAVRQTCCFFKTNNHDDSGGSSFVTALTMRTTTVINSDMNRIEATERINAWNHLATNKVQEYTVKELPVETSSNEKNDHEHDHDKCCRLDRFAVNVAFSESLQSHNAANIACRQGLLQINDTKTIGARRVSIGDRLTYINQNSDRRTTIPKNSKKRSADRWIDARLRLLKYLSSGMSHSPLQVLYEDDYMAIVCKPPGIHTMSWSGTYGKSLCLDEILPLILQPPTNNNNNNNNNNNTKCFVVDNDYDEPLSAPLPRHRLDHRVTGPIVIAKTRRALITIGRYFEEKVVKKEYRAIVVGQISDEYCQQSEFTIDSDIDGRSSQTIVQVLGQTPCIVNGILTDLKLYPLTGRKHQLRIHCAQVLGTPILGDDLYHPSNEDSGSSLDDIQSLPPVRKGNGLYLYCRKISLPHPILNRHVSAKIEEPYRFIRTRTKALKGYTWTTEQRNENEIDMP